MLEVEQCLEMMLNKIEESNRTQYVDILECCGKIIAEDVVSPIMVPHFPKSAMDGYAVNYTDVENADENTPVKLSVSAELMAGDFCNIEWTPGTAVRVMTGAYVPNGYNAVIKQEDTDCGDEIVEIRASVKEYMNYCKIGEDICKGDVVIKRGTKLTPYHAGMLASIGVSSVKVKSDVRVSIISTGSELMPLTESLKIGKIYGSISYILANSMKKENIEVVGNTICEDDEELLKSKINEALEKSDLVITTGAVSVGKKDIVPKVLSDMGAEILFSRANIQPGTPTTASVINNKIILSLSGNPYAAIANFELYFWPLVAKMAGDDSYLPVVCEAVLQSEYPKKNKLRRLIRAYAQDGEVIIPSQVHSSSVISNMSNCNCFIDMEAGRDVKLGETVKIRYFK